MLRLQFLLCHILWIVLMNEFVLFSMPMNNPSYYLRYLCWFMLTLLMCICATDENPFVKFSQWNFSSKHRCKYGNTWQWINGGPDKDKAVVLCKKEKKNSCKRIVSHLNINCGSDKHVTNSFTCVGDFSKDRQWASQKMTLFKHD